MMVATPHPLEMRVAGGVRGKIRKKHSMAPALKKKRRGILSVRTSGGSGMYNVSRQYVPTFKVA